MKQNVVKILETYFITPDVIGYIVERPKEFDFEPGQATEVSINKDGWREEMRPFTFTSLPDDDFLQFIIKIYPDRKGVTNELQLLKTGDELILHDVFGSITFQGSGTFIAGGAGITPFISIFRSLQKDDKLFGNRLIFANKTSKDIILHKELRSLFGRELINILSEEKTEKHKHGLITKDFLQKNMAGHTGKFYVCGPPPMNEAVVEQLGGLGIPTSSIIQEGV